MATSAISRLARRPSPIFAPLLCNKLHSSKLSTSSIERVLLNDSGDSVSVHWSCGRVDKHSTLWMRHHNRHEDEFQYSASQKLLCPSSIAPRITFQEVRVQRDLKPWGDVVHYSTIEDRTDGFVPASLLDEYQWLRSVYEADSSSTMLKSIPVVKYEATEAMRFQLYRHLIDDGCCVVSGTPTNDKHYLTNSFIPQVLECEAVQMYFGIDWDVIVQPKEAEDVGNTRVELALHQDIAYREAPPGLLMLHCLSNSSRGGDSLLADGLAVCEQLKRDMPHHFRVLSTTPVMHEEVRSSTPFTDTGEPIHYRHLRPIIEVDTSGRIIAVRLDSCSEAILMLAPDEEQAFFAAYRELTARARLAQVKYKLTSGDLLVCNNRRMMHGRSAIAPGPTERYLKSAYVDIDRFRSKAIMVHARNGVRIEPRVGNNSWL